MEQSDIDNLIQTADLRAVYVNQVGHAKDRFRALNRMFWEGHEFEVTQSFYCYVVLQFMAAQVDGAITTILLDINEEPVMIEDLNEFVDMMQEEHAEALNEYHDLYDKLKYGRDADELIEGS